MKDFHAMQLDKVAEERRALIEQICLVDFIHKARLKEYPVGSKWFWSLGAVYGPGGSADEVSANGRS